MWWNIIGLPIWAYWVISYVFVSYYFHYKFIKHELKLREKGDLDCVELVIFLFLISPLILPGIVLLYLSEQIELSISESKEKNHQKQPESSPKVRIISSSREIIAQTDGKIEVGQSVYWEKIVDEKGKEEWKLTGIASSPFMLPMGIAMSSQDQDGFVKVGIDSNLLNLNTNNKYYGHLVSDDEMVESDLDRVRNRYEPYC